MSSGLDCFKLFVSSTDKNESLKVRYRIRTKYLPDLPYHFVNALPFHINLTDIVFIISRVHILGKKSAQIFFMMLKVCHGFIHY
jgi:hypothetical protein